MLTNLEQPIDDKLIHEVLVTRYGLERTIAYYSGLISKELHLAYTASRDNNAILVASHMGAAMQYSDMLQMIVRDDNYSSLFLAMENKRKKD